jgi:hypothetical protein
VKTVATPCPECPFSKKVKPGRLGGSSPFVYIGQAEGPFALPCHKHCDFGDPDWKKKTLETPQCAGAAIYRSNVGASLAAQNGIPSLPASPEVFESHAEFLAHHTSVSLALAKHVLRSVTPHSLMEAEMGKVPVLQIIRQRERR